MLLQKESMKIQESPWKLNSSNIGMPMIILQNVSLVLALMSILKNSPNFSTVQPMNCSYYPLKCHSDPCLDFQGYSRFTLENSSNFWTVQPLTCSYYPLKCHSYSCLDFWGFSRFPLENSSNIWTVQPLTWTWKFQNRLSLTWKTLELRGRGQGSLWVKVLNGHPSHNHSAMVILLQDKLSKLKK